MCLCTSSDSSRALPLLPNAACAGLGAFRARKGHHILDQVRSVSNSQGSTLKISISEVRPFCHAPSRAARCNPGNRGGISDSTRLVCLSACPSLGMDADSGRGWQALRPDTVCHILRGHARLPSLAVRAISSIIFNKEENSGSIACCLTISKGAVIKCKGDGAAVYRWMRVLQSTGLAVVVVIHFTGVEISEPKVGRPVGRRLEDKPRVPVVVCV